MSKKNSLSQSANAGAWAWAKYRDEVIDKALKAVDSQAVGHTTEKIKHRWSQVNWESVSSKYQQSIQKNYGTTRVLGKPDPISLEGIFTDLHILDKPTAYRRYDIEKLTRARTD